MNKHFLVLTELFLPTKGGTAVWFDEVYRRLGGKSLHIVTAQVPDSEAHDQSHPNTIHRLDLRRVPWLRPESLVMYLKFFWKALSLAATRRFDGIHAGRALPEGLVAWLVARLTFHRVTLYAHGEELTTWGRGKKYKAMRFALRHADQVIANSDFTRQTLLDMGVSSDRIEMIHPGVNLDRYQPGLPTEDLRQRLQLETSSQLILSVGRLSRRKGFDMVIKALPALVDSGIDAHYAIIGIGEDDAYLRNLAEENGLSSRVHMLGHVPMDELPRWYNACDVFVLANREINGDTEGFGMVFIEAAACGKPAIAGTAGGTGSAVIDGETGLRVDGADLEALAHALKTVLGDETMRNTLGRNGLERARRELSWDAVAAKTRHLEGEKT